MQPRRSFFIHLFCCAVNLLLFFTFLLTLKYNRDLYWLFGEEGKWIERATSIFYLVSSIFCVLCFFKLKNHFKVNDCFSCKNYSIIWILFWAFLFFFITGEEESWGQWIFNLNSPENIKSINYQNEINIHNLNFIPFDNHTVLNLICLFFGVLFPFVLSFKKIRSFFNYKYLLTPDYFVTYFFITGLLYEKTANLFEKSWIHTEFSEFFFSIGFFSFAISAICKTKLLSTFSSQPNNISF